MNHTTGIILAGGRNRRMGKNKALLPLPGDPSLTFLAHLASILTVSCAEVLVVARDPVEAAGYALPGIRVVFDITPDLGPLMGLYSGLRATQTQRALVVAVDTPFLQPSLVSFLLLQPLTDTLLVPLVNSVPQVLLALYPRSLIPFIEQCLSQGRRDPRCLLDRAPVHYIGEEQLRQVDTELRSFISVNTPEELREIM